MLSNLPVIFIHPLLRDFGQGCKYTKLAKLRAGFQKNYLGDIPERPQSGMDDLSRIHPDGGPEHVSGAENGAERAENRLEQSRAVSGVHKIKWSVSGAGAGGRRNGNRAVSGQNLPLKIRSTIKPLKVKSSKSIVKVTTKLSVLIH